MSDPESIKKRLLTHRRTIALREFRTQNLEKMPRTFQDFLRFAAENTTGFVAVDFDGWGRLPGEVTEMGLTYVPPPAQLPAALHIDIDREMRERRAHALSVARTLFKSHGIRINGRVRDDKNREGYWQGPPQHSEPEEVEEEALKLLRSFRGSDSSESPCLVGFGLGLELQALLFTYPRLLKEFTTIIDLQPVVQDLFGTPATKLPSLRNTLIACDLRCITKVGRTGTHCAANDAARIALLLVKILSLPPSPPASLTNIEFEPSMKRYKWAKNRLAQPRKFWEGRPMPRELYPYTAVLLLKGEVSAGQHKVSFPSQKRLFDYFNHYGPIASGVKPRDIRRKSARRGYLSFESLESLNTFVQDAHEKSIGGRLWLVYSKYDPSVRPVSTFEEYTHNRRESQMAKIEVTKEERQEKRKADAEVAEEDMGSFFNAMFVS